MIQLAEKNMIKELIKFNKYSILMKSIRQQSKLNCWVKMKPQWANVSKQHSVTNSNSGNDFYLDKVID